MTGCRIWNTLCYISLRSDLQIKFDLIYIKSVRVQCLNVTEDLYHKSMHLPLALWILLDTLYTSYVPFLQCPLRKLQDTPVHTFSSSQMTYHPQHTSKAWIHHLLQLKVIGWVRIRVCAVIQSHEEESNAFSTKTAYYNYCYHHNTWSRKTMKFCFF